VSRANGSDPIERLRAVDPVRAQEVPAASLARVSARVEEHVMTDIEQTAASRRRRPLALVGGLTMAAAFAVAVAAGSNLGGAAPTPTEEPGNPAAGGGGMAMCLAYDPANLPTMETVFDGTVTAIDGDQVTFAVNEGWKGVGESITLTAPDTDVALLGQMPDFEVGGRYLVTASGSDINACNYTIDYDADEAADWAAAFED
jgi:hypothetical protein